MSDTYTHFKRLSIRWLRDPKTVVTSMVAPAAWLIFVGMAMPANFTDDYLYFVTPGILAMAILFSSLAGGSLLTFDKMQGFLNKFLALPSSRESILFGNISFITFRGLLQAAIILIIAVLFGVRLPGPTETGLVMISLAVFGALLSAVAITVGLYIKDVVEYSSLSGMVVLPLFFSSSALMPYDRMPEWLRTIASVNPVSIEVDTIRTLMAGEIVYAEIFFLAAMAAAALTISTYAFRKATI